MVHKLVNIYTQSFKSQSLCNTYFYGLRGRQTQGPPRAAHTLATPLCLSQRGPTTFDLRAILQKRDNLRATSNKIMCNTTDSQDLKLKRKISECVMENITQ